jgi:hypothetical protein
MITKKQYVEYLVSPPKNCTGTSLAEHREDVSHDVVNDFLHQKRVRPREVWELVKARIADSQDAFLLGDDSVQDNRSSRFIEVVRAQDRGNEHRVLKGSGVGNWVPRAGKDGDFYPIDERVYAPDVEGKTKNDHFQAMFLNALDLRRFLEKKFPYQSGAAGQIRISHLGSSGRRSSRHSTGHMAFLFSVTPRRYSL